jgi:hypothetical protein
MSYGGEDRWTWRAPVVGLFVLLALLAEATATLTGWSRATLINTEGYVTSLVKPLAVDPEVRDAVATELARQMTRETGNDFAGRLLQWVPPSATAARAAIEQWGAQLEQGWREELQPAIRAQLDTPEFTSLWIQANREAHRQFMDAIADARTGAVVRIDLHSIAQQAVRETGVQLDQQLGLPGNIGATVYAAIADSLPPETGVLSVDVSRFSSEARTVVQLIDPVFLASLGLSLVLALIAVGVAPARRRGTALAVLGVLTALVAGALRVAIGSQADTAADRAASAAVEPLSAEVRFIVDRQAQLAADSFNGWAIGLALVGAALALIGIVWRLISGRAQPAPFVPGPGAGPAYGPAQPRPPRAWDDTPAAPWSSRGY